MKFPILFAVPAVLAAAEPSAAGFSWDSGRLSPVHGAKVERGADGSVRLRMASAEWSAGMRLEPPEGSDALDLSSGKWLAVDVENCSPDRQLRLTMHVSGPGAAGELDEAKRAIRTLGGELERAAEYTIPGTEVRHTAILIRKSADTPARYPRRWAQMKKQPL